VSTELSAARRVVVVVGAFSLLSMSCADNPPGEPAAGASTTAGSSTSTPAVTTTDATSGAFRWTSIGDGSIARGFLDVPVDYDETERFEVTGAGAGPIMVVGNTGDPATPYEGSRAIADTLEEGFFVSVEADTHTAYGLNDCINTAIEDYLVHLSVPAGELVC
jgi:TAP-like protein